MENEKFQPEAIASYDRLKRDFARLCVLLDARRDGYEAGVMVGPVEDAHVETLEALFDRLHKHLQSLEFFTAPGVLATWIIRAEKKRFGRDSLISINS